MEFFVTRYKVTRLLKIGCTAVIDVGTMYLYRCRIPTSRLFMLLYKMCHTYKI